MSGEGVRVWLILTVSQDAFRTPYMRSVTDWSLRVVFQWFGALHRHGFVREREGEREREREREGERERESD